MYLYAVVRVGGRVFTTPFATTRVVAPSRAVQFAEPSSPSASPSPAGGGAAEPQEGTGGGDSLGFQNAYPNPTWANVEAIVFYWSGSGAMQDAEFTIRGRPRAAVDAQRRAMKARTDAIYELLESSASSSEAEEGGDGMGSPLSRRHAATASSAQSGGHRSPSPSPAAAVPPPLTTDPLAEQPVVAQQDDVFVGYARVRLDASMIGKPTTVRLGARDILDEPLLHQFGTLGKIRFTLVVVGDSAAMERGAGSSVTGGTMSDGVGVDGGPGRAERTRDVEAYLRAELAALQHSDGVQSPTSPTSPPPSFTAVGTSLAAVAAGVVGGYGNGEGDSAQFCTIVRAMFSPLDPVFNAAALSSYLLHCDAKRQRRRARHRDLLTRVARLAPDMRAEWWAQKQRRAAAKRRAGRSTSPTETGQSMSVVSGGGGGAGNEDAFRSGASGAVVDRDQETDEVQRLVRGGGVLGKPLTTNTTKLSLTVCGGAGLTSAPREWRTREARCGVGTDPLRTHAYHTRQRLKKQYLNRLLRRRGAAAEHRASGAASSTAEHPDTADSFEWPSLQIPLSVEDLLSLQVKVALTLPPPSSATGAGGGCGGAVSESARTGEKSAESGSPSPSLLGPMQALCSTSPGPLPLLNDTTDQAGQHGGCWNRTQVVTLPCYTLLPSTAVSAGAPARARTNQPQWMQSGVPTRHTNGEAQGHSDSDSCRSGPASTRSDATPSVDDGDAERKEGDWGEGKDGPARRPPPPQQHTRAGDEQGDVDGGNPVRGGTESSDSNLIEELGGTMLPHQLEQRGMRVGGQPRGGQDTRAPFLFHVEPLSTAVGGEQSGPLGSPCGWLTLLLEPCPHFDFSQYTALCHQHQHQHQEPPVLPRDALLRSGDWTASQTWNGDAPEDGPGPPPPTDAKGLLSLHHSPEDSVRTAIAGHLLPAPQRANDGVGAAVEEVPSAPAGGFVVCVRKGQLPSPPSVPTTTTAGAASAANAARYTVVGKMIAAEGAKCTPLFCTESVAAASDGVLQWRRGTYVCESCGADRDAVLRLEVVELAQPVEATDAIGATTATATAAAAEAISSGSILGFCLLDYAQLPFVGGNTLLLTTAKTPAAATTTSSAPTLTVAWDISPEIQQHRFLLDLQASRRGSNSATQLPSPRDGVTPLSSPHHLLSAQPKEKKKRRQRSTPPPPPPFSLAQRLAATTAAAAVSPASPPPFNSSETKNAVASSSPPSSSQSSTSAASRGSTNRRSSTSSSGRHMGAGGIQPVASRGTTEGKRSTSAPRAVVTRYERGDTDVRGEAVGLPPAPVGTLRVRVLSLMNLQLPLSSSQTEKENTRGKHSDTPTETFLAGAVEVAPYVVVRYEGVAEDNYSLQRAPVTVYGKEPRGAHGCHHRSSMSSSPAVVTFDFEVNFDIPAMASAQPLQQVTLEVRDAYSRTLFGTGTLLLPFSSDELNDADGAAAPSTTTTTHIVKVYRRHGQREASGHSSARRSPTSPEVTGARNDRPPSKRRETRVGASSTWDSASLASMAVVGELVVLSSLLPRNVQTPLETYGGAVTIALTVLGGVDLVAGVTTGLRDGRTDGGTVACGAGGEFGEQGQVPPRRDALAAQGGVYVVVDVTSYFAEGGGGSGSPPSPSQGTAFPQRQGVQHQHKTSSLHHHGTNSGPGSIGGGTVIPARQRTFRSSIAPSTGSVTSLWFFDLPPLSCVNESDTLTFSVYAADPAGFDACLGTASLTAGDLLRRCCSQLGIGFSASAAGAGGGGREEKGGPLATQPQPLRLPLRPRGEHVSAANGRVLTEPSCHGGSTGYGGALLLEWTVMAAPSSPAAAARQRVECASPHMLELILDHANSLAVTREVLEEVYGKAAGAALVNGTVRRDVSGGIKMKPLREAVAAATGVAVALELIATVYTEEEEAVEVVGDVFNGKPHHHQSGDVTVYHTTPIPLHLRNGGEGGVDALFGTGARFYLRLPSRLETVRVGLWVAAAAAASAITGAAASTDAVMTGVEQADTRYVFIGEAHVHSATLPLSAALQEPSALTLSLRPRRDPRQRARDVRRANCSSAGLGYVTVRVGLYSIHTFDARLRRHIELRGLGYRLQVQICESADFEVGGHYQVEVRCLGNGESRRTQSVYGLNPRFHTTLSLPLQNPTELVEFRLLRLHTVFVTTTATTNTTHKNSSAALPPHTTRTESGAVGQATLTINGASLLTSSDASPSAGDGAAAAAATSSARSASQPVQATWLTLLPLSESSEGEDDAASNRKVKDGVGVTEEKEDWLQRPQQPAGAAAKLLVRWRVLPSHHGVSAGVRLSFSPPPLSSAPLRWIGARPSHSSLPVQRNEVDHGSTPASTTPVTRGVLGLPSSTTSLPPQRVAPSMESNDATLMREAISASVDNAAPRSQPTGPSFGITHRTPTASSTSPCGLITLYVVYGPTGRLVTYTGSAQSTGQDVLDYCKAVAEEYKNNYNNHTGSARGADDCAMLLIIEESGNAIGTLNAAAGSDPPLRVIPLHHAVALYVQSGDYLRVVARHELQAHVAAPPAERATRHYSSLPSLSPSARAGAAVSTSPPPPPCTSPQSVPEMHQQQPAHPGRRPSSNHTEDDPYGAMCEPRRDTPSRPTTLMHAYKLRRAHSFSSTAPMPPPSHCLWWLTSRVALSRVNARVLHDLATDVVHARTPTNSPETEVATMSALPVTVVLTMCFTTVASADVQTVVQQVRARGVSGFCRPVVVELPQPFATSAVLGLDQTSRWLEGSRRQHRLPPAGKGHQLTYAGEKKSEQPFQSGVGQVNGVMAVEGVEFVLQSSPSTLYLLLCSVCSGSARGHTSFDGNEPARGETMLGVARVCGLDSDSSTHVRPGTSVLPFGSSSLPPLPSSSCPTPLWVLESVRGYVPLLRQGRFTVASTAAEGAACYRKGAQDTEEPVLATKASSASLTHRDRTNHETSPDTTTCADEAPMVWFVVYDDGVVGTEGATKGPLQQPCEEGVRVVDERAFIE